MTTTIFSALFVRKKLVLDLLFATVTVRQSSAHLRVLKLPVIPTAPLVNMLSRKYASSAGSIINIFGFVVFHDTILETLVFHLQGEYLNVDS